MPIDLNNPFAQALIQQGRSRGYNPMSIAASIGNASAENGLRTNGAPGDNGTAFGGFQWRQDRKDALMRKAQAMGKSWDDPSVQAAHWYDEQDGSESRWGLKNAKDLQSANNAVVSALRPAGWNPRDPTGAHNYSGRLSAAEEAFRQMNGGQAPQMLPGQNPQADMPAPDAQETGFQIPGGPPKEGLDAFLDGGPGALFGKPQEGWNVGDALGGAGIAMMARDNPSGAAALASYINGGRKSDKDKFTSHYDAKSGKLIRIPTNGGQATTQQINTPVAPTKEMVGNPDDNGKAIFKYPDGSFKSEQISDPKDKPIPVGAIKLIQDNDTKAEMAYNVLSKNQEYLKALKDGKLDLSVAARIGDNWKTAMNDSDEKTRMAASFLGHIQELRNARLLDAKGQQTEGDAVRAMDEILPGITKLDNKATAAQLQRLSTGLEGSWNRHSGYNEPLYRQYKTYDPDGVYQQRYKQRKTSYETDRDSLKGEVDSWMNTPVQPKPDDTPITGRDPIKTPRKPEGSFLDFYNRKK